MGGAQARLETRDSRLHPMSSMQQYGEMSLSPPVRGDGPGLLLGYRRRREPYTRTGRVPCGSARHETRHIGRLPRMARQGWAEQIILMCAVPVTCRQEEGRAQGTEDKHCPVACGSTVVGDYSTRTCWCKSRLRDGDMRPGCGLWGTDKVCVCVPGTVTPIQLRQGMGRVRFG